MMLPPPPPNFVLFELDLDVKFPLLRLLLFLSDLKSTIFSDFDSKEDVINAILGSSFVPLFSGFFPPK